MIGASFDGTETPLQDPLTRADNGKLQLREFQRGWLWDDRINSLLASVSVSFPTGTIMLVETRGEHVRFNPRPLAGAHERLRMMKPETLTGKIITREPELFRTGFLAVVYHETPEEDWDAEDPLEEAAP